MTQHGEGNGNPLQYSCLENPIDGGAWWAAVHGVAIVAYVLPFFSLRNMPDLGPKDIDLGVKPSAPSCPPTLPPYLGLQAEQTESQRTPPQKGCLGLSGNPN